MKCHRDLQGLLYRLAGVWFQGFLGFRLSGLGFGFTGFKVQGLDLRFRGCGQGFRVLGFRALGF